MKVTDKIYSNSGNTGIIRLIKKLPSNILDVGCGAGNNAYLLKELGNTIDGITISQDEMELATASCRNTYIFNLENGLPNEVLMNRYTYIICSHVLEHIAFPEKLLTDIYNLASKNKATILIALPNIMYFKTRFKLLLGKFEYTHDGIMDYTHLRWYTKQSATRVFEKYNFNVKSSSVTGLPPLYSLLRKLGKKPTKLINSFLFFIAPTLFGSELLFELECN